MSEQKISDIMQTTMDKIKTMVTADTIIGEPIISGELTLIPVSKLSFGFASGGTDHVGKAGASKSFVGGGGAGATVTPVGFLVVRGNDVKVLSMDPSVVGPVGQAIGMLPDTVEKIKGLFSKK